MPDGGFVTTYSDITDRKQAARMEIANEAKSQFLENMSHDLRKPIAAIIEDVRLFLDVLGKDVIDDRRRNLENIQTSANHLLGMVDELLEMSRIEAGQVEVRPEEVDLEVLALRAVRVIEPVAKAKGVTVQTRIEDGLQVTTDPRLLSRILINLVSNAAEYTPEGLITVSTRRSGGNVEIEVADTGVGIPKDKLEIIFEKFQQVEPSAGIKKPGVGLGLGLAISRECARLLGGDVAVESTPGKGSVFTVSVPIVFGGTNE
jgi:signal transduction histidine kinase